MPKESFLALRESVGMPPAYICGRVCTTVMEPSSSTAPSMSCALPRASSITTPTLATRLIRSFLKPSSAMSLQNHPGCYYCCLA